MSISKPRVQIVLNAKMQSSMKVNKSFIGKFEDELSSERLAGNIDVEVVDNIGAGKSQAPFDVQIFFDIAKYTLDIGMEATLAFTLGKLMLEPLWQKIKSGWQSSISYRDKHTPYNVTVNLGKKLTISTTPFLFNEVWLLGFFDNLEKIQSMLDEIPELAHTQKIQIVSNTVNKVIVLAYLEGNRPDYIINLKTGEFRSLFDNEKEKPFYKLDEDNGLLGLDASNWATEKLIEAKLYEENRTIQNS